VSTRGLLLAIRIFVGTAAMLAAVLGVALAAAARSANSAAESTVTKVLSDARDLIDTQLDEHRSALTGQAELFAKNPEFRASVEQGKRDDLPALLQGAVTQIGATWVQVASDSGVRLTKSNEPGADTVNLSGSALIDGALKGSSKGGYGADSGALVEEAAVPVLGMRDNVVGALIVVRALDSAFAASLKKAAGARVDVAFFALDPRGRAHLVASTIGQRSALQKMVAGLRKVAPLDPDRVDSLSRAVTMKVDVTIGGTNFAALGEPLRSAGGAEQGGFVVLRNDDVEFAAFNRLKKMILRGGALGLLALGLLSFGIARKLDFRHGR
jgi:hypothetical protein